MKMSVFVNKPINKWILAERAVERAHVKMKKTYIPMLGTEQSPFFTIEEAEAK